MTDLPASSANRLFVEKLLNNPKGEHSPELEEKLRFYRKEKIRIPIIFVASGSCGIVAGANRSLAKVKSYLQDHGTLAEVIEVGCIGLCSSEPIVDVQLPGKGRISFEKVLPEKVDAILDAIFNNIVLEDHVLGQFRQTGAEVWPNVPFLDSLPFFALQKRIVLKNCGIIDPGNINEYISGKGYKGFQKAIRSYTPLEICEFVKQSGLRGRGGGGYLSADKWLVARSTESDQKYLVCNCDESDPGAFMDRAVIEGDPHSLLEGIGIAAYAIGASKAFIYIRAEYQQALIRLRKAIADAQECGLLGKNILGSGFNLSITVKTGAGAFVCGEETALLNALEGKRGMPRPKPPFPAINGLFARPSIVNNVETLANVPSIINEGPDWFCRIGTSTSKGTKVFALSGKTRFTGLVEIPMGTSLRQIIYDIAGGIPDGKSFKAAQIGGPTGGCIAEENLDVQIDYDSLKKLGTMMGSGGLVVMDESSCMVDLCRYFLQFIHRESCGKCIPCREGTHRMFEILESITRKPKQENGYETLERFKGIMQLENLAEVIRDTSLCGLGKTAPTPVLTSLKYFREEFEEHIFERKCQAGVCRELRTFIIEIDKCTGCTLCARKCPTGAIIGSIRNPHFIVSEKCTGCGICYEICKFNAVIQK